MGSCKKVRNKGPEANGQEPEAIHFGGKENVAEVLTNEEKEYRMKEYYYSFEIILSKKQSQATNYGGLT